MRARLIVVFIIPLIALFAVLGVAYGRSVALAAQQELFVDRLDDTGYLVTSARQALRSDDPTVIDGELERYREVYGIEAAVLDRAGDMWVSSGLNTLALDDNAMSVVQTALAGRRSEAPQSVLPWTFDDLVVAEPIFDAGDLIGAVVTSSSTDAVARDVLRQWGVLALGGLLAIGASLFLVSRLANWVLRPIRRVDSAMTEMWHGHMEARISDTTGPPELRHMIAMFNAMAEEVEHLIHRQQEFVSNASHELRNPLNALLLRIEHLAMGVPEEWADEAERAREEGRRMTRILDALLMLARGQHSEPETSPVDLRALVERRLDAWQPISEQHDVALRLHDDTAVWGMVDEIVIESAFDAVLDNAVKYSPARSSVDVSVTNGDEMVEIAVRDHGPGLPGDELARVDERFWRGSPHQEVAGSGLGLAIATEFLASCGGTLGVAPADSGGLVVTLRMPASGEQA
ncbi:HAMP domain-containing protein [Actinobacteria bacterium YIM 96077]|uniref:histidine kinase n=1 Tax=Phytoactinopolyspora halophila TaxID=1981511 RepID=A0A329QZF6_9ACTN|nr:ATP-binding protein [Phytoactinopolyspora halophila]AYY13260.1 HAMP domain-containing protein [Actinobacteria bacterium YIM 96077]RAW17503.1 two-component sensor histidine kinase [Phytoactinopolyspora halophila]